MLDLWPSLQLEGWEIDEIVRYAWVNSILLSQLLKQKQKVILMEFAFFMYNLKTVWY